MNFNPQPLPLTRRTKVAVNQLKLRISRGELMFPALIATMQSASTGVIVHLDVVDTMRNLGSVSQAA